MDRSIQASSAPLPLSVLEPTRPIANFHPTIWGNYFLKFASDPGTNDDSDINQQIAQMKEDVRKMMVNSGDRREQQLKLIDEIQRLGVSYHFKSEIDVVLNDHLLTLNDNGGDLYMESLRFRLLRQHGHNVSCDVFEKFKDGEGRFKEYLTDDVRGLLSLYEATHMRVHKEEILDEALEFTTSHLEQVVKYSLSDHVLASKVVHALKMPIRKGLTRLEARHYIPIYQMDNSHDETLLKFAKLDFNKLQKLHQSELGDMTRWWKDFNVAEKLPYARDRFVECYFWALGVYFEPQYSHARRMLTKVIAFISLIDDTYDSYGTFEELSLFTDAIQRWDVNAKNQLPEYMRHIYGELLDVYNAMEEELSKEGISYRIDYAKQTMKQQVRTYFDEAIWYNNGYVPTMEEYLKVALVSCGYIMLSTTSFVGMGVSVVPNQAFDWVTSNPLIVEASSVVNRLSDDKVGHKIEQERGHVVSAVECYMKQHNRTEEETIAEFKKRVTTAWKDMNQECLHPIAVPMHLLERVLNFARFMNVFYEDEDCYTNSKSRMKDCITSLLVESIPI